MDLNMPGRVKRGEMDLNMSGVDVRELMCEMYCGVMVWFTRVGYVRGVTF